MRAILDDPTKTWDITITYSILRVPGAPTTVHVAVGAQMPRCCGPPHVPLQRSCIRMATRCYDGLARLATRPTTARRSPQTASSTVHPRCGGVAYYEVANSVVVVVLNLLYRSMEGSQESESMRRMRLSHRPRVLWISCTRSKVGFYVLFGNLSAGPGEPAKLRALRGKKSYPRKIEHFFKSVQYAYDFKRRRFSKSQRDFGLLFV